MKTHKPLWVACQALATFGFLAWCAGTQAQAPNRPFLVIGEESAPFEFIDLKTGKAVGIDIDICEIIFAKLGIKWEVQLVPWKRAWLTVEEGKADAVLSTSRKAEREPFLHYPEEPMWSSEFVFFTSKSKKKEKFKGYEDIVSQKMRIGVIAGNSYHDSFWTAFPYKDAEKKQYNDQIEPAKDAEINFAKLAAERIDVFPADRIVGRYQLKRLGLLEKVSWYDQVLFAKPYPMPFVKKSDWPKIEDVMKAFDAELKLLKKSGAWDKIRDKWLTQ